MHVYTYGSEGKGQGCGTHATVLEKTNNSYTCLAFCCCTSYVHTCLYRNWTSWWIPRIDYIRRHERRFCCGAALVVPIHLKLIKNTEAKFKDEGRRRESPVLYIIIHFPYVFHSSHLYVTYCFVSNIVYYLKMRGHSNEVASSQTTCRGLDARYYYKTSIVSATTRHLLSMLRLTLLRSMEFQFYCGQ